MKKKLCILALITLLDAFFFIPPVLAEGLAPTNASSDTSRNQLQQSPQARPTQTLPAANTPNLQTQSPPSTPLGGSESQVKSTTGSNTSPGIPSTGSINPVSPQEFTGKVNNLVEKAHEAGKSLVYRISQVMIILAGLMLLFSLFLGQKILQKSFMVLFCVGLGVFVYLNAGSITGIAVWLSKYFGSGGN